MIDYKKLILDSKSVRSFKNNEVDSKLFSEIEGFVKSSKILVPGIETEIKFYGKDEIYSKIDGLAGYNGFLIDSPHYMLMFSEEKENYIENAGYIAEKARLKATELGVDSCWITFEDGNAIIEKLGILTDKKLVALVAFGYAEEAKKKVLNATKTGDNYSKSEMSQESEVLSSERKAIEEIVFMDKWNNPADLDSLEERALLDAFSFARLAPSALNRQPWRFIVDGGKIVLAVDTDELENEYVGKIESGIAMLYFGSVVDSTLMDTKWVFESDSKDYGVPENYKVVGYCKM